MNKLLLTAAAALTALGAMADNVPAFPGAEGFARYTTTGGRGGEVRHVTNLNDSGSGSLREALKGENPKIIVFDVSGYIDLESDLAITSNTTIAGQTAPEGGITLRYRTVYLNDCMNVIIRFIRMRRSQLRDVNDGADAATGRGGKNIILDHCSFSWSIDEVASFYDNRNFTMQWCTVAEGLANPGHNKGAHSYGGIWGGKQASFHHNFIAHVQNRAPRFNGARYASANYDKNLYECTVDAERVDFRNCVMYNWGTGSACYGGPGGGYVNIINNYYKAGPGTKNKKCVTQVSVASSGNADTNHPEHYGLSSRYYVSGNYVTADANPENYDWKGVSFDSGILPYDGKHYMKDANRMYGSKADYRQLNGTNYISVELEEPSICGDISTQSAEDAYDAVINYSGACLYRDAVDERYMEEATTGTVTYYGNVPFVRADGTISPTSNTSGILDFINDPNGELVEGTASFPELPSNKRKANFDFDNDGIPDYWEEAHGLNPERATDAKKTTLDPKGWYTNIEVYLNSLVEDIVRAQNANSTADFEEYYPLSEQDFVPEIKKAGDIKTIEYYSLDGCRIAEPQDGICIRRIIFNNGNVKTDKVVK